MRFKLTLRVARSSGRLLPLNYQYEQSAVIYRVLANANRAFSAWLHNNGFEDESGKRFRLFTYSRFYVPQYLIKGRFMEVLSEYVEWYISFLPENSTAEFIQGLFHDQSLEVGNREAVMRFEVQQVSLVPPPDYTGTMAFETLSPICLANRDDARRITYVAPDHSSAPSLIQMNLISKYHAFTREIYPQEDVAIAVRLLSKAKPVLITIKTGTPQESKVRGFLCRLALTAPPDLMKIAYECGLGVKNSIGFGMVKAVEYPINDVGG
ncbi:CRISPR-associated endoribonuclease Cas6 [Limibacterium fermenti]|uniref:CRISPR-associated endoribonuclease Cas6 n=1 Tax=Limibacterium fermenti TaxID=3229863 RepID=UPI000E99CB5F|nr:CRISPR-associated endoribonuclease Cas6 [Porphyromonadaceae bacterium]